MDHPKVITGPDAFLSSIDRKQKTIVFTNGCFDLLHPGHLHLLQEAKKAGDILVLGVNEDASVKRLKGESRPVETTELRMSKLAALKEVDYIIPFAEDTPLELIQKIRPDVLIKGGDYREEDIVGAGYVKSYGGKVIIVPLLEGFSTSSILQQN